MKVKVNYIDEKGNNVIKDIDVNFENLSVTDMIKTFKGCTNITNIPEMNLSNVSKVDLEKVFSQCNGG